MRTIHYLLGMFAVTATIWACTNAGSREEKGEHPFLTEAQMIERGEYLVATIGCDDCHSPKRMGPQGPELIPELRLSGYPAGRPLPDLKGSQPKDGWMLFNPDLTSFVGPWGVSFSANITSDGTDIGNWTESNFITAMRSGKMKGNAGGRPILAYLKTTAPVRNVAPEPISPEGL